ncbi:MAG: enoyl-CoA hydratase/isomerase family protein [Burkholderiaceae bacterium]
MSADPVLFGTLTTASGHRFGRATLNAPASLNALSLPMVDLLGPRLGAWAADPGIAAVVLDAVGDKAFCAGGDVVALYRSIRAAAPGEVPIEAARFFEREYRLDFSIHTYPKPLLCWGNGIVMGGGIGLLAGASHRVVTATARLAMPEIAIGLYPDVGGSWFLARAPGRAGLFLALTGAPLNAGDARFAGLGDIVLNHADHDRVLEAIAAARWDGSANLDSARLSRLLEAFAGDAAEPASPLASKLHRIDAVIGRDTLADAASRIEALATDPDPWLAAAAAAFARGSPTSARLSFEMQRRARHLSLAEVFRLEYRASVGCCLHPDFAEGVRALLVDKDKAPRWSPARLADVTDAYIDEHLAPSPDGPHPLGDLA